VETQQLLNLAFGVASAVLGWFARELWSAVKSLKDDIARLREEIAGERVHKDDFRHALEEVKSMLGKIFDRLDAKADK
jgi:hypothetical protein